MVTDNQREKRREAAEEVHREYQRKYQRLGRVKRRRNELQNKAYREVPRVRQRSLAGALVRAAIKAGRLVREECEVCGKEPTEAHHDDYSKPYDVRWLCKECHTAHHQQKRRMESPMTGKLTEVAQALHAQTAKIREGLDYFPIPPYEHDTAGFYASMAKAAIEAMREPTHEMLDAGDCTLPQFDEGHVRMECLRIAWRAMADAALGGKE